MRLKQLALSFLGLALLLPCTSLMETAQAGPRGGGGAGRGGAGPGRGGDAGVGGGRAGFGAGGVGGPASGVGVRPGLGAGRPGVGAGGVGGPASGIGVLPGAGAGRPGVGAYPAARPGVGYGGVGGPYSGIGVLPGAGAGLPGVPALRAADGYEAVGAYGAGTAAEAAAIGTAAVANPSLETGAYAAHPNAWVPRGVLGDSLYANPGYAAVAARLGLAATAIPYAAYGPNAVVVPATGYAEEGSTDPSQQGTDQSTTTGGQTDASGDWQPLGVFAMVDGKATSSSDLFQLTVNSQGQLRGNYHNMKDNSILALAGSVDPKTQRASWTIGGDKLPVYETSIANLTTNEAPMVIHLPDGGQRQFNLVRQASPQPAK